MTTETKRRWVYRYDPVIADHALFRGGKRLDVHLDTDILKGLADYLNALEDCAGALETVEDYAAIREAYEKGYADNFARYTILTEKYEIDGFDYDQVCELMIEQIDLKMAALAKLRALRNPETPAP